LDNLQKGPIAVNLDPEQEITEATLAEAITALGLHEDISPRLLYRILSWASATISEQQDDIRSVLQVAARIKLNNL
jgi:hypothetical protein